MDCSFFIDTTKKPNSRIEKCIFKNDDEQHGVSWEAENNYHLNDDDETVALEFAGIIPNILNLKNFYKNTVNKLRFSTDYIGAIRVIPQIDMRLQNSQTTKSGVDGNFSYQMLIADALGDNIFLEKVSNWYEKNFAGWGIEVDKSRQPVIHIVMEKNGFHTNITETGMGIIQSLPIVIRACAPCQNPTLITIEEPETHLHPAAHASLSELIALSIKEDANKRYLIETHSKNFILRIRRLIANKQLDVNDVALYYVSFDEENAFSTLRQVNINKNGSVDFWPSQMFDESLAETIAIRSIQLKQANQETK